MFSVVACGLALLSGVVHAQKDISIYDEQGKLLRGSESVSALGPDLFGDQVSLYTGSLEFVQTDVTLPGNSGLPVAVGRRFRPTQSNEYNRQFGDWDLEVPHVHGVFATEGWLTAGSTTRRCSEFSAPPEVTMGLVGGGSTPISPEAYWQGSFVYLPGSGDQEILKRVPGNTQAPTDGSTYPLLTKSGGMLRCISIGLDPNNEGFELLTPDGTRYRFNHFVTRQTRALTGGGGTVPRGGRENDYPPVQVTGENGKLRRNEVWIVATQVTDRYGNKTTYNWSGSQLMSISSAGPTGSPEDARSLTFTYASGRIQSVTAQSNGSPSRTWTYQYDGSRLWKVHLPDNSYWEFTLTPFSDQPITTATDPSNCNWADPGNPDSFTGSIRHPSGATGAFTLTRMEHGRSWVKYQCIIPPNSTEISGSWAKQPLQFGELSLTNKTITGAGLPGYTWTYAYNQNIGATDYCWDPVGATPNASPQCTANSATTKIVSVTDPRGFETRYTYGIRAEVNEGQLLKTEVDVSGSAAARTVTIEYQPVGAPGGFGYSVPWPSPYGESIQSRGDHYMAQQIIPEKRRLTVQQATTFEWAVQTYDSRARPIQIIRNRVLVAGASITEKTTYHDNTAKWILGQVAKVEARQTIATTPWQIPVENTYHSTTATLTQQKRFGLVIRNYGWNADGTLSWSSDGLNHQTTYQDYKRGIPRQINYPNGDQINTQVNDTGEITHVTQQDNSNDFADYTVVYEYDDVGRLERITPPAGDATGWNPTTLTFEPTDLSEFGLNGTHWRQTVSTGDTVKGFQKTVTYFDALWRPVLIDRHTTTSAGVVVPPQRKVRMAYDADGRTTFESYPKVVTSPQDPLDIGTATTYDALGRVTNIKAATESQLYPTGSAAEAETQIAYLDGFRKRVRDANENFTTTSYQVFDTPTEDAPTSIEDPVGTTTIERDIFGKMTRMIRSADPASKGIRTYVYDDHHRLCKRIDPESWATVFAYDGAGNVDWQASGLNRLDAVCETSVPSAAKVDHTYDERNRLTETSYGDGSPTVSRLWTPDSRPRSVTAGAATWTYKYNRRRLLLEERLTVSGTGGTTGLVQLQYAYTANGSLDWVRYPSGTQIDYTPNLFGEPTTVGTTTSNRYASNILFHANSGLASFTYGNGIGHSTRQNTRGLPWEVSDGPIMDREYRYDRNGNVTYIDDRLASNEDRLLTYDRRNRLTVATFPFSYVQYDYDQLDNITSQVSPARNFDYKYDARGRLYEVEDLIYPQGEDRHHRYAYDPALGGDRGNVTRRKLAYLHNVDQDYVYNLANQMKEVRAHGTGGATLASYEYDGNGRRVRVTEGSTRRLQMYSQSGQLVYETITTPGQPVESTEFFYLGRNPIARKTNGVTTYIHTDALGSVTRTTSSTGTPIENRVYEPYGESLEFTTREPQWPQGMAYTGHVLDNLTRLTYAQARHYDQLMGRFMSVDPVEPDAVSFNRYWYANNNPFSKVDPDGREAKDSASRACRVGDTGCNLARGDRGGTSIGTVGARGPSNAVAKRLAGEITQRGAFKGKGEADWLYQNNSDPELKVTVDASRLTVKAEGKWVVDKNGGMKSPAVVLGEQYDIHGQTTVRYRPDGTYGLYAGKYDFEMHKVGSLRDILRNVETLIGGPGGGWSNTPYSIYYEGNVNIINPYDQ